ncbi:MAG: hypothetical protein PHX21_13040 [bacterium]|nr:hypothetical protein [bacterium]
MILLLLSLICDFSIRSSDTSEVFPVAITPFSTPQTTEMRYDTISKSTMLDKMPSQTDSLWNIPIEIDTTEDTINVPILSTSETHIKVPYYVDIAVNTVLGLLALLVVF